MKERFSTFLLSVFVVGSVLAQESVESTDTTQADTLPPPRSVSDLRAYDTDNDHGHSITLQWRLSPDDGAGRNSVAFYEILRWTPFFMDTLQALRERISNTEAKIAELKKQRPEPKDELKRYEKQLEQLLQEKEDAIAKIPEAHARYPQQGEWRVIDTVFKGISSYVDVGVKDKASPDYMADYTDYYYRVDAVTADPAVRAPSEIIGPVQSYGQWFNTERIPVFVAVIVFALLTVWFVAKAKKGADLYVRPLAGIDAVDDAIGRATEMGKPILYVLGLGTADSIATIASFTILHRVAKRVAEYQTELIVPCYDPIVMTVAQEVVKGAYLDAGRPEDYKEDIVYFVTQSQFAYVAAVNGVMLRQLPATNMYLGKFYAESLILAETGAVAGSIQISGTDEIAQLPFFIVACDYTLIGEELYAASAYLGREPLLLGSLKAQDYAKAAVIILAVIGLVAANLGWTDFVSLFHVGK
jgi:hypothetical protein